VLARPCFPWDLVRMNRTRIQLDLAAPALGFPAGPRTDLQLLFLWQPQRSQEEAARASSHRLRAKSLQARPREVGAIVGFLLISPEGAPIDSPEEAPVQKGLLHASMNVNDLDNKRSLLGGVDSNRFVYCHLTVLRSK